MITTGFVNTTHDFFIMPFSLCRFFVAIDGIYFFFPEIPLPNEQARMDILKIHSAKITKHGDIGRWSIYLLSKAA